LINLSTNEGIGHMVEKQSWDERNSRRRERQCNDTGEPASSYRSLGPHQDRLVEQGLFGIKQKLNIGIAFDRFPVWLVCVNKLTCFKLTIMGFSCKENMLQHVQQQGVAVKFLCKLLEDISAACLINYCGSGIAPITAHLNLMLVSGSSAQQVYDRVHRCDEVNVIGSLEVHFTEQLRGGKPSCIQDCKFQKGCWHRIRHSLAGRTTEFVTLISVKGLVIDLLVTTLRRTIRHFVDYGIRAS
jgi:hypothetical protein